MTTTRIPATRHAADPPRRTGREIATGLAAGMVLLAIVVGLPAALYTVAGIPWPHHTPSPGQLTHALTQRDNGRLFLAALLVVAWLGWAVFTVSVAVEAAALVRGTTAVRLPGFAATQRVAATLLAAVAILVVSAPQWGVQPADHNTVDTAPLRLTAIQTMAPRQLRPADQRHQPPAETPAARHVDAYPTYVVHRGDTLWSIAENHLGDPERWREILHLNRDQPQPDGRALTDAHWIYPGWILRLPADATGVRPTAHPGGNPRDHGKPAPTPQPTAHRAHDASPSPTPAATPDGGQGSAPAKSATTAPSITLASGTEIGTAFGVGVLAAMTVVRLRRRRGYTPSPPGPAIVPTSPAPPAPLRDLLTARRGQDDETTDSDMQAVQPAVIDEDVAMQPPAATIEAGTRHDAPVHLDLMGWPGLTIHGPHADDVVRAWIGSLLTHSGPPGVEVISTGAVLDRVLPGVPIAGLPVWVLPDNDSVLIHLESEQLRRTRLLADADLTRVGELQQRHPEDPLPVIVAALGAIDPQREPRWNLLFTSASRIGLTVLRITDGASNNEPCLITITTDGKVENARPQPLHDTLAGARLFQLGAPELGALLQPVAAARHHPSSHEDLVVHLRDVPASDLPEVQSTPRETAPSSDTRWPTAVDDKALPIIIRALGPITITAWGREIEVGLRDSARELLTWYLLHPEGAPAETAIEAIWPDAPPDRGPQRFWNALGNLRSRLRGPGGQHVDVLSKVGDVYRANADEIDADLWRFQNALANAARDDDQARQPLQRAVDLYTDDLAGTATYLWIEPIREELHRRALDAHVRLAELHDQHGDSEAAVNVLERAIALDPVAEDLYRRLIRLLARTGRRDGIDRLWAQLQTRLADIDTEPEPTTVDLVSQVRKTAASTT